MNRARGVFAIGIGWTLCAADGNVMNPVRLHSTRSMDEEGTLLSGEQTVHRHHLLD